MKKRPHRSTSAAGEAHIAPHKATHKERIVEALGKLRVGGTHEQIAIMAGMRPDQVWKRLSEAANDKIIFDTGTTRKLKSGLQGCVWQLTSLPEATLNEVMPTILKKSKKKYPPINPNQQPFLNL